jgi:hypothetical protein
MTEVGGPPAATIWRVARSNLKRTDVFRTSGFLHQECSFMFSKSPATAFPAVMPLLVLLFAGPALAQQDAQQWMRDCERQADRSRQAVFCEVRPSTIGLDAGALSVDAGPNGGVIVRGGQTDRVEVSARISARAATEAEAQELARQVRVVTRDGRVHAEGPRSRDREWWTVTYYITVPQRADLDLSTVNGPVAVYDVTGRIRGRTTNGPVTLERLAGDVEGRSTNGPVSVVLHGQRWDGSGISAVTTNGPVTLSVPEGYSAELETGSVNGRLNIGFPVTVTVMGRRTNRLQTTLGSGGPLVRVVTTNGPVSVRRD